MGSMADFMRTGGSLPLTDPAPSYVLDVAGIETRLGAPLGPVLLALSKLACTMAPDEPCSARVSVPTSAPSSSAEA
jgi:hypothetical protein